MPQKRNPVPFEHVRILASKTLAQAQGVFTCLHNTPFGDINDAEDDLQPLVFSTTADAIRAIALFTGILGGCEVRTARMAERAAEDFLTVTELADTLVRREGMSFREAHRLVSAAVKALNGRYSPEAMVDAVVSLSPSLTASRPDLVEALLEALDPRHFVNIRRIPGGPAPEVLQVALEEAESHIAETQAWLEKKTALMAALPRRIDEEGARLAGPNA